MWRLLFQYLIFCFLAFCLYCWIAVSNDYIVFDKTLYDLLNVWFNWSWLILLATVLTVICHFLLLVAPNKYLSANISSTLTFRNLVFVTAQAVSFILIVTYCIIAAIWRPEWQTVAMFFSMTWPCLHLLALIFVTTAFCVKLYFMRGPCSLTFISVYVLIFIVLFFIPFTWKSPCIREGLKDLQKPLIFGHKGFPKVAPENTLLSFEESNLAGVDGYEADVAVSMDGVPFLIHDVKLQRTSNVAEVYPNRKDEPAEGFTWFELSKLNFGKWYFQDDPYRTVYKMSSIKRQEIQRQKVLSLYDLASLAKKHNKKLMFDLRQPRSARNPHFGDYIQIIVETLLKSGINQSQVLWISGPYFQYVLSAAPNFVQVYGDVTNAQNIAARHISLLILEYNTVSESLLRKYKDLYNIGVIVYTSSTQWSYSLAWCQEAYAVISDDPRMHHDLTRPIWSYSPHEYHILWTTYYMICSLISLIVIVINRRLLKRKCHVCSSLR